MSGMSIADVGAGRSERAATWFISQQSCGFRDRLLPGFGIV